MSGGVSARLRHQVLEDGRVLVTVLGAGERGAAPALCVRLDPAAVKAFAWGLLADLDPEEAYEAGAPLAAFGHPASREMGPSASIGVRRGPGPKVRRVLAACPLARAFVVGEVVAALAADGLSPALNSARTGDGLRSLLSQGLACLEGKAEGRGRPVRWRLTRTGAALQAALLAGEGAAGDGPP